MSDGARQAVRAATEAAHLRLHAQPRFASLAAGRISRDDYRDLLGLLYGFHAPLERALLAHRGEAPVCVAARADLLQADLQHLGLDQDALLRLPQADGTALPAVDTPGRWFGCLYVREGSTLGGRVMARMLDPILGAGTEAGRRFLTGPADWAAICAALERAAQTASVSEMIAGAQDTFNALERWLNRP